MYLLDTDILSNLIKRVPSIPLIRKLAAVGSDDLFTSSVTLGELVYGAYRAPTRTQILLKDIEEVLLPNLIVLPFDSNAAYRYGEVRADLVHRGMPIGDADMRIGAIALIRDFTVVTGNVRHFQRISGLNVENWFEE